MNMNYTMQDNTVTSKGEILGYYTFVLNMFLKRSLSDNVSYYFCQ
jgi:hypothetical protein